jgi:hypothetical protein
LSQNALLIVAVTACVAATDWQAAAGFGAGPALPPVLRISNPQAMVGARLLCHVMDQEPINGCPVDT